MTTRKTFAAMLTTFGLLAGGNAFGADQGFYIGGSWGQARPDWDTSSGPNTAQTLDSSDVAWGVQGGYQFNKYLGIEGSYINLGSYAVSNGNTIEPTGWGILLVGTLPIPNSNLSLVGKAGEYRMRQKMDPSGIADNTWSPAFGAGLKYNFSPNAYGTLDYMRIQNVGSSITTINENINVYTMGLGYKFY